MKPKPSTRFAKLRKREIFSENNKSINTCYTLFNKVNLSPLKRKMNFKKKLQFLLQILLKAKLATRFANCKKLNFPATLSRKILKL